MSELAKYLILASSFLVLAISFAIGVWAKKKVTSPEAFFGGAKIFGPLTVGLATMAAVGSAFAVVGVPGLVYSTGNTILLFMFAAPAFVFSYLVIGKKIRGMAEIGTVASLGDLSDLRFNHHRGIKLMLSIMLFLGCAMYLSAQVEACAKLFENLFDWNQIVISVVIFSILIAYTVLSGEIGGILTQAFQGLVIVVAGIIFIVSFFAVTGGFGPVLEAISGPQGAAAGLDPDAMTAWGSLPGSFSFAWVLLPTLGIMCQPQVLTRMMMLRDPRDMPQLSIYAVLTNMVAGMMVMASRVLRHLPGCQRHDHDHRSRQGGVQGRGLSWPRRAALRLPGGTGCRPFHLEPVPVACREHRIPRFAEFSRAYHQSGETDDDLPHCDVGDGDLGHWFRHPDGGYGGHSGHLRFRHAGRGHLPDLHYRTPVEGREQQGRHAGDAHRPRVHPCRRHHRTPQEIRSVELRLAGWGSLVRVRDGGRSGSNHFRLPRSPPATIWTGASRWRWSYRTNCEFQ